MIPEISVSPYRPQSSNRKQHMSDETEYPELYLKGIEYFNECEFFESHEVWEEIWTEDTTDSRKFYQGLIQAAVALHHFGNENVRGARKLNVGCRKYLDPYRPFHMGLDLDKFLNQMDACFAEIMNSEEEFPKCKIVVDLIPEIHLVASPESKEE